MTAIRMYPHNYWLRLVPVILVMAAVFFLSHLPGNSFSLPKIVNLDKVLHGLLYTVLGLTALIALSPRFRQQRPVLASATVVLFCLVYGITDELHQSFVPGRSSDILDVVADTTGGLLAVLCGWCWRQWGLSERE